VIIIKEDGASSDDVISQLFFHQIYYLTKRIGKIKMRLLKNIKIFILLSFISLNGCVNYEQKTTLKEDGSGTMKIHYWSSMKNFSMGSSLGKFEFDEIKAREKYSSSNTTVNSLKVEDKLDDSTKHVYIELDFDDIRKISEAKGFEGVNVTWSEVSDGIQLVYIVPKDTSAAKTLDAGNYDLIYEFTMPFEIVSTNGNKTDQTVKYSYKLNQLDKDLEMIITVKKPGKKICGITALITSVMIIGIAYSLRRKK
jgi:hypothetical protein